MNTPPIGRQVKAQASLLATLIWARKSQGADMEYAAYEVIAEYMEDWTDERKADLYALIAESLSVDFTFTQLEEAVATALWKNIAWTIRG